MGLYRTTVEEITSCMGKFLNIQDVINVDKKYNIDIFRYEENFYKEKVYPSLKDMGVEINKVKNEILQNKLPEFFNEKFNDYLNLILFDGVFSFREEEQENFICEKISDVYIGDGTNFALLNNELMYLHDYSHDLKITKIINNRRLIDYNGKELILEPRQMSEIIFVCAPNITRGSLNFIKKASSNDSPNVIISRGLRDWAWDIINSNLDSIVWSASDNLEEEFEIILENSDKEEIIEFLKVKNDY